MGLPEQEIIELIEIAKEVKKKAYAPYSKYHVGCVVVDQNGVRTQGVNVENASFGLTICAERTAIGTAIAKGMTKLKAVVVNCDKLKTGPCGACRQIFAEFADNDTEMIMSDNDNKYKIFLMKDILPFAFSPNDLETGTI